MNITIAEVAEACGGKLPLNIKADTVISGISTDTREDLAGKVFVPLVGPTFDGHAFINYAYSKGAVAVLSEQGGNHISVESTLRALRDIASYYRGLFDIPVVGITGSSGKTTTKDIIASVLSQKYKTLKTEGNLNNEIGVPHTVFRLDDSYTAAVLEMGMNHAGEIHNLSKIGKPKVCVITNIGLAHVENLGSREGILVAKSEIFDFMQDDGVCVLNVDDDLLRNLASEKMADGRDVITYSVNDPKATVWSDDLNLGLYSQSCNINYKGESIRVEIPLPGIHMTSNALAAAAVGFYLGLSFEEVKAGVESFKLSKNRMDIMVCGDIEVINDVYNANPESMKAAISILNGAQNRTVAILGDMFELGEFAQEQHIEVGKTAADCGVHTVICIGELSRHIYDGFIRHKDKTQEALYFKTKEECGEGVNTLLKPNDTVLVKASRGMGFEYLIDILKCREKAQHGK